MRDKLFEPVFALAGRRYDWADVVLWARTWGGWADFEAGVRLGLAWVKRAEDGDEDLSPDESEVEDAANEFRYDRGLLSAEEMEAWLARCGLSAEAWMASMRRAVLKRKWSHVAEMIGRDSPVTDEDVAAVLWCDGVCSGELTRYAREVAGRAAVCARLREEDEAFDDAVAPEVRKMFASAPEGMAGTVLDLDPEACREKLAHLARLEVALRHFSARALTSRAVHDQLSAHYLDWIRLDCHVVSFPDEQMAREAVLSVREDGLPLSEVAELAGATADDARVYLDEAAPSLREHLLSAAKGDLVGPVPVDEGFLVVLVRDKVLPTEADPEIRRRIERSAIARLLVREIDARAEWLSPI
ncbi:MAG TPA: hypothetical protein VGT40_15925 [Methylomirabilota bacterium]|jgi:hypothetical protein|nr:hypothetical protein [Methylomirabilota bacterium]